MFFSSGVLFSLEMHIVVLGPGPHCCRPSSPCCHQIQTMETNFPGLVCNSIHRFQTWYVHGGMLPSQNIGGGELHLVTTSEQSCDTQGQIG